MLLSGGGGDNANGGPVEGPCALVVLPMVAVQRRVAQAQLEGARALASLAVVLHVAAAVDAAEAAAPQPTLQPPPKHSMLGHSSVKCECKLCG